MIESSKTIFRSSGASIHTYDSNLMTHFPGKRGGEHFHGSAKVKSAASTNTLYVFGSLKEDKSNLKKNGTHTPHDRCNYMFDSRLPSS